MSRPLRRHLYGMPKHLLLSFQRTFPRRILLRRTRVQIIALRTPFVQSSLDTTATLPPLARHSCTVLFRWSVSWKTESTAPVLCIWRKMTQTCHFHRQWQRLISFRWHDWNCRDGTTDAVSIANVCLVDVYNSKLNHEKSTIEPQKKYV